MKKINLSFILIFMFSFISCSQEKNMTLTLDLSQYLPRPSVRLYGPGFNEKLDYDSTKVIVVKCPVEEGSFYSLDVDLSTNVLYLEPGKDLKLTAIKDKDGSLNLAHLLLKYEGANADINSYLNTCELDYMQDKDFLLDENEFIKKIETTLAANTKQIKSFKLDKDFESKEEFRTKYMLYEKLTRYPIQHFWINGNVQSIRLMYDDTPVVKEYITKQFLDTDEAWKDSAYRTFVKKALGALATTDLSQKLEVIMNKRIELLVKYFQNPVIREDVVHSYIMTYLENTEGADLKSLKAQYDKYVTSPKHLEEFKSTSEMWARLQDGQKIVSSDAVYYDAKGNAFKFEDLKGKYVYVDVWASWCGPCKAEIPFLKKLEKACEGKNIAFVGISLDARRSDWLRILEKEKLEGIQVLGGPEAQIAKDYKIEGIPRFLLLDREGRLINGNMTRPSDPKTKEVIDSLEGI